jgi:hypothetical protein
MSKDTPRVTNAKQIGGMRLKLMLIKKLACGRMVRLHRWLNILYLFVITRANCCIRARAYNWIRNSDRAYEPIIWR